MKRLAIWICTFWMVCSFVLIMPMQVQAKKIASGTCGANITWVLDSNGTLTFSGAGEMEHFSPYSRPWEGRPVAITTVVIEAGITSIGNYAFADLEHLVSVTIPDTVMDLGGSTFQNCVSLQQIKLPKYITSIPSGVFMGCSSLQSIVIPDKVEHIWHGAFQDCTSLRVVTMPVKLRFIEHDAFAQCPNLWHILYAGRKGQFRNIAKYSGNEDLKNAHVHYQCGKNVKIDPENQVCSVCIREKVTTVAICAAVAAGAITAIVVAVRRRNRLW